ncbi:multiple inositol polyphosphate phosphatase 1 [Venturia canescens]|uniref:multiple inositol polyphosphate phosphatase 1 n=1 Tax=Venturia canescens TaxID=32260 RepID=UPI001C9CA872|nr:multiple inositol polyphosphate phosphatase 1 [Venturia canescens]
MILYFQILRYFDATMTASLKFFELFFIVIVFANLSKGHNDCFTAQDTFECRLGSMTPYRLIANKNDSELNFVGCKPKKIWLLVRHGTRYPGKKWTLKMLKDLPTIWDSILESHSLEQRNLSQEEIELFQKWKFRFSDQDIMHLTEEGEKELVGIAERFQSRFPSIMPEIYTNQTFKFQYTATQRTESSAKNFALGLFGRKQSTGVWYPSPLHKDPILRFYKLCRRWQEEVDDNPESYRENEKFVKSLTVSKMLADVSKRVGFALNYANVHLIYMICAFETAWFPNLYSPWCSLLSLDNFKVLEYAQDLQYYWIDGYGYSLTYEQACSTTKDVFDFFQSDDEVTTRAYFTHSGTVLKILALLGIAKDEEALKHDSFARDENRLWRTSLIDSFASNIAFVLYNCEIQGPSILLMHQERFVQLENCPVGVPCPLSTMKMKYPDHEAECSFNEMCAN